LKKKENNECRTAEGKTFKRSSFLPIDIRHSFFDIRYSNFKYRSFTMKTINTDTAPAAVGPYSQAVISGNLVFTAGQIPLDPQTNELVDGDVAAQTEQVLQNLSAVLKAAGSSLEKAVKVTVFIKDMNAFSTMNAIYEKYFTNKPARSTVEVARLPKDVLVEMDVVAEVD